MSYSFVCSECGGTVATSKGYNSDRTKKRLVCKHCGKNVYVLVTEFEGSEPRTIPAPRTIPTPTQTEPTPTPYVIEDEEEEEGEETVSWNAPAEIVNAEIPNTPALTADIVNEREEAREPDVAKTRILSINGQTGAFPNFTEDMIHAYARAQNHALVYRDGIYYLTSAPGTKG